MTDLESIKSNPSTLTLYLSRLRLNRSNGEWIGKCPWHNDDTASFHVSQHGSGWFFKDFGACGIGGDVVAFLQRYENVGFKEAVELAEKELGTSFDKTKKAATVFSSLSGLDSKPPITYPLSEYKKYEDALINSPEAIEFLKSRGITLDTALRYHTGFRQTVAGKGTGWLSFPSTQEDTILGIKYRSIGSKEFQKQSGMARGEQTPLYNSDTINSLEAVYLCEGELDSLTLEQSGFRSCSVQSASTPLTATNKEKLLEADYIVLAGDNDLAGNDFMDRAWRELGERTFKLVWPAGFKDANQTFLEHCGGDIEKFRTLVEDLTLAAKGKIAPGISSLAESLKERPRTNLEDDPRRWVWPWPGVDKMATIMPGSVVYWSATQTGQGKTTALMNASIFNAMERGRVILNYSAELSNEEYAQIVVSHLMKKSRHALEKEDYDKTYRMIADTRYYIGRDNDLPNVMDVLDLVESAVRRSSCDCVIIDTIHFLCVNEKDVIKAQENAMNRCKSMAQRYGLIWFNLGQPRKANQQFKGKAIHITDAKGSEMLTSASDVAYAMHRELAKIDDPNNPPKEPYQPLTQIFLQKGRNQGTGSAYTELLFDGDCCTLHSVTKEEPPEGGLFR